MNKFYICNSIIHVLRSLHEFANHTFTCAHLNIKELGLRSLKHGWAFVAKSAVCFENCGFSCSLRIIFVPGKSLCTSPPYLLHRHKRSRFYMLFIREQWLGLESPL
jgi:hypothetical protein